MTPPANNRITYTFLTRENGILFHSSRFVSRITLVYQYLQSPQNQCLPSYASSTVADDVGHLTNSKLLHNGFSTTLHLHLPPSAVTLSILCAVCILEFVQTQNLRVSVGDDDKHLMVLATHCLLVGLHSNVYNVVKRPISSWLSSDTPTPVTKSPRSRLTREPERSLVTMLNIRCMLVTHFFPCNSSAVFSNDVKTSSQSHQCQRPRSSHCQRILRVCNNSKL